MAAIRLLSLIIIWITIAFNVNAQCDNYGIQSGTNCTCPPGVGGADCSLPVCGGTLYDGPKRPTIQPIAGALYGNLSSCTCPDGWNGVACNICSSSSACTNAYTTNQPANIGGSVTGNDTGAISCSTTPRVYAVGQMSCTVNNPTIQALYPGKTALNILRNLNPANTLAANVSSYGAAGTVNAQLWYEGEEQFFCNADTCTQSFSNGTADWMCHNLKCHCRANATFCGAVPATAITSTIDDLSGDLEVKCTTNADGSVQCAFLQATISSVFGSAGLVMDNCQIGECVAQSVIDAASGASPTSSTTGSTSTPLSGGVIAGLAVVGALALGFLSLFLWGWLVQRKARRSGAGQSIKSGGVGVTWSAINYSVPAASSRPFFKRSGALSPVGDKLILTELSGEVNPGEMLAILGPSGAGKTTLIEILGGKSKIGITTGTVMFAAVSPTGERTAVLKQPRIGYVDQADILPSMLTVQEALLFAARLRLPDSVTQEAKQERVFEVMRQLGILDIKDTRIGDHERRGISGGEQRRVSIGLELVACPDVLVLDEPTSGLDSVSANKVVSVLRELAHDPTNPTAIIASIHQPNSKLYQLFDKVLVLSLGKELYFGPGGLAPNDYFAQHGHPAQPGYNVADHLLDIASEPTDDLLGLARRKSASRHSGTTVPATASNGDLKVESDPEKSINDIPKEAPKQEKFGSSRLMSTYSTTFLTQLQVLCGREWKILKRDKSLFFAHLLVAAVLGAFCGGLYFKTGITIAGFQSRVGCLFFLGSLLSFSALSALYNLIEVRPLFLRERAGSFYSPTAWLLSRFFFDVLPLRVLPTIVVSTIVYWMAGLAPDAAHFFKFLFILVLYTFAMTLFNFLLACTFRNGGIAILLSALFNLFIMTFAGFFVHLSDIPEVLRWLQWFSLLKYCLEALAVNEVGSGLQIVDTLSGVPVNVSAQLIMNLLFGFGADNYYRDVLVLFAFIAGFGISLIMVVWLLVRERR